MTTPVFLVLLGIAGAGLGGCGQGSEAVDEATVIVREPGEAILSGGPAAEPEETPAP